MVPWVKDPELPQLWRRLKLWLRFDPWTKDFHMLQVQKKKKKSHLLTQSRRGDFLLPAKGSFMPWGLAWAALQIKQAQGAV